MTTAADVQSVARATSFRADVVEKVLRLHGILARLDAHETTTGTWVLKGGTALNLLYLDVQRLSIDIDVNYVGDGDVDGMRQARPLLEQALASCWAREGCEVRRDAASRCRFARVRQIGWLAPGLLVQAGRHGPGPVAEAWSQRRGGRVFPFGNNHAGPPR